MSNYEDKHGKHCVVWDDNPSDKTEGKFDRYVPGAGDLRRRGYRLIGQNSLGNPYKNIYFPEEQKNN